MAGDVFDKGDPKKLFKLLNKLATGSYGTVFKAQNKKSNDTVALKVIALEENDSLDEFLPEISIMRCLSHPNVVRLHGAWKKGHDLFIAMELCGGGAASDLYTRVNKPVPEVVIQVIARESLRALDYIHEKAVIHRDIKAANILLTMEGAVKLTDFGVSAQLSSPADKRKSFIGTPYWLAPEVVMVNLIYQPYSNKVDIWSLGITCIELAETKPPRFGLDPTKAMNEIPRSPPPKLVEESAWSEPFHNFLTLSLEKNPDKRPSAKELLKHIWLARSGDLSLVSTYIMKTQRGEWDPSTGKPPTAPPPPVPQATLDHMAPTTYGRRMTKASIEEVLKLQSAAPEPGSPFYASASAMPSTSSTPLKPAPRKAPAPAKADLRPPLPQSPSSYASPPPVNVSPSSLSENEQVDARNSPVPSSVLGASVQSSLESRADADEAASGVEELQPSWSRPPPAKPPPPVPNNKRPALSAFPPPTVKPPPSSSGPPMVAPTSFASPSRLPPPLMPSPNRRPISVLPTSLVLPPPPSIPQSAIVLVSPARLPPPPPAPVLPRAPAPAPVATVARPSPRASPTAGPLVRRSEPESDDVRVPPRPTRTSPQRPERAQPEAQLPPRRAPPTRAVSPTPQRIQSGDDSGAFASPPGSGPQAMLALALMGKPPALRRTQAPQKNT